MDRGGLDHVRRNPNGCSRWLSTAGVVGGVEVAVVLHDHRATTFDVGFESPAIPELSGYLAEQVRVTVRANGEIFAVPVGGEDRTWLHRYPRLSVSELLELPRSVIVPWDNIVGSLCLEYPKDPATFAGTGATASTAISTSSNVTSGSRSTGAETGPGQSRTSPTASVPTADPTPSSRRNCRSPDGCRHRSFRCLH